MRNPDMPGRGQAVQYGRDPASFDVPYNNAQTAKATPEENARVIRKSKSQRRGKRSRRY